MPRLSLLVLLGATACTIGTQVTSFAPAIGPRGVAVRFDSGDAHLHGELLAVSDSGLLLLRLGRVEFVPYPAIPYASFAQLGDRYDIDRGRAPDPATRGELRLLSRFPQGVTPELLSRLLATSHQDSLIVRHP